MNYFRFLRARIPSIACVPTTARALSSDLRDGPNLSALNLISKGCVVRKKNGITSFVLGSVGFGAFGSMCGDRALADVYNSRGETELGGDARKQGKRGKYEERSNQVQARMNEQDNARLGVRYWSIPDDMTAANGIATANVTLSLLWFRAGWLATQDIPQTSLLTFMRNHFFLSFSGLMSGRIHTLVTYIFSHPGPLHLLLNSVVFLSLTWRSLEFVSAGTSLAIYLGGGMFAGLVGALSSRFIRRSGCDTYAGGSGGMFALAIYNLCARERGEPFAFLPFDVPETLFILILLYEAVGFVLQSRYGTKRVGIWTGGHGYDVHLGGAAFGAAAYYHVGVPKSEKIAPLDTK